MTSGEYAMKAMDALCDLLAVDRKTKGWQAKLAPFALVWAAMIAAAADDFTTAVSSGAVDIGAGATRKK